ncbi:thioesterase family protein [Mycolicibacillus parakoreensis]|uniref:Thioesterase family protein n=1 Tax=Mycolicibacillus parakoreensis TaxID=1069221 RepID=A0ABY3TXC9_9MYCO|nr:thioesterase family protein [Mycolicibacillus parakoreensis]MCV7316035.1 thioesterase family protein [Mycolicibacillus parakoreensis]ULN52343.1 thioesterase family protein [Mycolicibacillus parakoreensis]
MNPSALFSDAMRLTPLGTGPDPGQARFGGELNEHWTIGPKVHGGAMLALCANAARTALGATADGPIQPVAVSGSFLRAPDPGALQLRTRVRKRGRRVSVVDVELDQHERTAVHAVITLGQPEHDAAPLLSVNPIVSLMIPEPPPGLAPIGPGHPMAEIVHLAHGCDIRPALTTLAPRSDGGPPVIEMWVRPKGAAPDVLFALLCGDASAPVTMALQRPGWAPTVQLTAYLRGMPADGWLRVICTTTEVGVDWFDEDHLVVDCRGRIVAQTRQLAMVPAPPA